MLSIFLPFAITFVDKLCNVLCVPWYGLSFPAACALVWSQFSCRLLLPVLISYVMFCVCPGMVSVFLPLALPVLISYAIFCVCPGMVSVFLPLAVTCVDKLCNVLCVPWYGVSFPAACCYLC